MISARSLRLRLGSTIGEVCQVITTFPMKTNLSGTHRIVRTGACYMSGKLILTTNMTKRSLFASRIKKIRRSILQSARNTSEEG